MLISQRQTINDMRDELLKPSKQDLRKGETLICEELLPGVKAIFGIIKLFLRFASSRILFIKRSSQASGTEIRHGEDESPRGWPVRGRAN